MRLQILLIPFIFVTALPILATAQEPVHRNPFYQGSAWTLPRTPLLLVVLFQRTSSDRQCAVAT